MNHAVFTRAGRRKNTVSETVQRYCIYGEGGFSFRDPTLDDVRTCRVVVTTLATSLTLARANLEPG